MLTFQETGLLPEIIQATDELGFVNPTPVQEQSIPTILNSEKDLVALAQTGTGKTAAFGLPIIHQIDLGNRNTQTLVLCPTRELCIQIAKDLESFAKYMPELKILSVFGGANIVPQLKALRGTNHIVVGTPGRTLDLINRKALKVQNIKWLVLDEADEMLNMGFQEDLDKILADTPETKKTYLFSATMPKEIRTISRKYMSDANEITIGKVNMGNEDVTHAFYMVQARDRYKALKRLADINPSVYGIIFCRTRQETKDVADKLMADGYNADALHGDLSQQQRDHVMNRFRSKHLQLLVATDVAARGLDVNELTHVINYNLPDDPEVYVHRSGRTGRAGNKGECLSIIHSREMGKVRDLERIVKKKFDKRMVPGGQEICEKQLFNLVDKVENIQVDESQIEPYLEQIYQKLSWLEREDLIKHFVSVEFNRFLSYYKGAPDLNVKARERRNDGDDRRSGDRGGRGRATDSRFTRFFINVGKNNDLNAARLIGLVNDATRRKNIEIGKIDILKGFSFFEVDKEAETDVLSGMKGMQFEGTKVSVEVSKPDPKGRRSDRGRSWDNKNKGGRRSYDNRGGDRPRRRRA